jgi:hypothetical protein
VFYTTGTRLFSTSKGTKTFFNWPLATSVPQGCQMVHIYIFKQKIPIVVYFERSCNGKGWYTYIFYGHLESVTAIWFILWQFGYVAGGNLVCFPPFWYVVSKKSGNPGAPRSEKQNEKTIFRFD